ncbi:MAG: beta-ketoacyl-ACP synthase III [Elusimicrobiota bacterium]
MDRIKITGTGSYLPEEVLSNEDLEKMVDTSDEWITQRTGIKERRIASEEQSASDLAKRAGKKAIEDAGIDIQDIDLVICCTITPDMVFPATACLIKEKLGIKDAAAFDVEAACTGFITGLSVGEGMLKTGNYKNALVIASEVLSRITDWQDRNTCVLFGDGAGAAVLTASEKNDGILSSYLGADGSYKNLLRLPAGGSEKPASEETVKKGLHYMKMAGRETFKIAIKKMAKSVKKALKRADLSSEDIEILIPHQANLRIIESLAKVLKVDLDRVFVNIEKYGNMSAATTAVGLDEAVKENNIGEGDIVQLVAFGGGLTWGSVVIKF